MALFRAFATRQTVSCFKFALYQIRVVTALCFSYLPFTDLGQQLSLQLETTFLNFVR